MIINKTTNKELPENLGVLISESLKEVGLEETTEEILEKIKKGKESKITKVARIISEVKEKEFSLSELVFKVQKELDLSKEKAEKLAFLLYRKILLLIEKPKKEREEVKKIEEVKKEVKRDIYREPID